MGSEYSYFLQAIEKAGFSVGSLYVKGLRDTKPIAPSSKIAFQLEVEACKPIEYIAEELQKRGPKIVGVIPDYEGTEETGASLAKYLDLVHNDPAMSVIRRNKALIKQRIQAAGLRVPQTKMCHSADDIRITAHEIGFPLVIKTPSGSSGHNVFRCNDLESLTEKHNIIISTPDDFGLVPDHSVVEEYIEGELLQVKTFSDGKKIHVIDAWLCEKVANQYAFNLHRNSWLVGNPDNKITEYVTKVAALAGITYGPGYTEVIVDKEGPALIEVHARWAYGKQAEMVQEFSNFDPFVATVEIFTGQPIHIPRTIQFSSHVAIASCRSELECKQANIIGLPEIKQLSSYHSSELRWGQNPKYLHPTTNLNEFPLRVWLANKDPEKLHQDVTKLHQLFHINC